MRTGYSPFDMCSEAIRIIDSHQSDIMAVETEKQVILLLNKSDSYKEMSAYQLSDARKKFAEYYYTNNLTGSALEQYQLAINLNPRISVKRHLKELLAINKNELVYSLDANMVGEPDMSNLKYYESPQFIIDPAEKLKKDIARAKFYGMSLEEYRKWESELRERTYQKLRPKAAEDDSIFDPEFEEYVHSELEKLGEDYYKSFYDLLERRDPEKDCDLSYRKWAQLTLQSLWNSKNATEVHDSQLSTASDLDFSNTTIQACGEYSMSPEEMLFLQYLHHKKASLDGIAGYWTHEYHMDYEHVIPKFFSLGFLQYADLNYALQKSTKAEMEKLLSREDMHVKRSKPELIQFLLSKKDSAILNPYRKMYYEVTPKGKEYLAGQDYQNKDTSFRY